MENIFKYLLAMIAFWKYVITSSLLGAGLTTYGVLKGGDIPYHTGMALLIGSVLCAGYLAWEKVDGDLSRLNDFQRKADCITQPHRLGVALLNEKVDTGSVEDWLNRAAAWLESARSVLTETFGDSRADDVLVLGPYAPRHFAHSIPGAHSKGLAELSERLDNLASLRRQFLAAAQLGKSATF